MRKLLIFSAAALCLGAALSACNSMAQREGPLAYAANPMAAQHDADQAAIRACSREALVVHTRASTEGPPLATRGMYAALAAREAVADCLARAGLPAPPPAPYPRK